MAALDRVQVSLDQVRADWLERARVHAGETNLRTLQTEPAQIALSGLEREQVGGRAAYKVYKGTTAAKVFERNGWREVKRKHSVQYFIRPDGSGPPADLVPVVELLVPARDEVVGLATRLHETRARAGNEVDGLQVTYEPSHSFRRANRAGKEYTRHHARFILLKHSWLVTATWSRGDDRPPE